VLCAVEKVNPKMPCTLDAQELAERNRRGEITGCQVDGPLALDNAVSAQAAKHKGIDSSVAGNADILLVQDIEAGNMLNKAMEYFGGAKKAGVGCNIIFSSPEKKHPVEFTEENRPDAVVEDFREILNLLPPLN